MSLILDILCITISCCKALTVSSVLIYAISIVSWVLTASCMMCITLQADVSYSGRPVTYNIFLPSNDSDQRADICSIPIVSWVLTASCMMCITLQADVSYSGRPVTYNIFLPSIDSDQRADVWSAYWTVLTTTTHLLACSFSTGMRVNSTCFLLKCCTLNTSGLYSYALLGLLSFSPR